MRVINVGLAGAESLPVIFIAAAQQGASQRNDRVGALTIKKIPKAVLSRCEWGHDGYSLRVEILPKAPPKLGQQELFGDEAAEE